MLDPTYPLFPICAFLSFVIVLIPLPWHLQSWNSGTCLFMFWVGASALNFFINSIIWRDNILDSAPIWCDISSRLIVGAAVGIPASSLCINRRLYKIASSRTASSSRAEKRNAVLVDLSIGLGLPILQMALQFIVQGHRYDIWEQIGCYPTTVNTPPAYPLSFVWPNVISLISAVYCILTLRQFMRRRAQFSQFLASNSSLSVNRYFRLMCLATAELIFNIPISSYGLYLNVTLRPIYRWVSWSDTHFDYWITGKFPAALWRLSPQTTTNLELTRWSIVLCAVVFFGFFGFAEEARKNYRAAYWAIAKRLGVKPPQPPLAASKVSTGYKPYATTGDYKVSAPMQGFTPKPLHLTTMKSESFQSSTTRTSFSKSRTSLTKSDYSATLRPTPTTPDFKGEEIPLTPTTPSTPSTVYHALTLDNHDVEAQKHVSS
ncbi:hypothetical protein D9619_009301 [Psilocybe cf. subviscida]|uniref:Uncharacterized protein n=1 Tax=Psilocybe cf. subviscida TaxID=2480587 RepID=A0A8H5BVR6_9AGAR|nr:hypothetical protein D9619_009301 [Psilocybe cf. subviscida]